MTTTETPHTHQWFIEQAALSDLVKTAQEYAVKCHAATNHRYDGKLQYSHHLNMVFEYGCKYAHLPLPLDLEPALAACWTHDIIEDTRNSYNDVKSHLNEKVAEITRACTNYSRGRTRAERMPDFVYQDIRGTINADFVKCCDRLANIKYSKEHQSRMLSVYQREHEHFKKQLYTDRLKPMFDEMEEMLGIVTTDK